MAAMHMIRLGRRTALALFAAVPAAAQDAARRPLPLPEAPEVLQRVLTTVPGARLAAGPNAATRGPALPVFSLFYVYARRDDWLEVGRDLRRGPEGWLPAAAAQNWSMMLTMKYAPQGQRRRVMFFEQQQDLLDLV